MRPAAFEKRISHRSKTVLDGMLARRPLRGIWKVGRVRLSVRDGIIENIEACTERKHLGWRPVCPAAQGPPARGTMPGQARGPPRRRGI